MRENWGEALRNGTRKIGRSRRDRKNRTTKRPRPSERESLMVKASLSTERGQRALLSREDKMEVVFQYDNLVAGCGGKRQTSWPVK